MSTQVDAKAKYQQLINGGFIFDTVPTDNSLALLTSSAVYNYLKQINCYVGDYYSIEDYYIKINRDSNGVFHFAINNNSESYFLSGIEAVKLTGANNTAQLLGITYDSDYIYVALKADTTLTLLEYSSPNNYTVDYCTQTEYESGAECTINEERTISVTSDLSEAIQGTGKVITGYVIQALLQNINSYINKDETTVTDSETLLPTSKAVQTYVVSALNQYLSQHTYDTTPTLNSEEAVTSDGIARALLNKQDVLTIEQSLTNSSTNIPSSQAVINYGSLKVRTVAKDSVDDISETENTLKVFALPSGIVLNDSITLSAPSIITNYKSDDCTIQILLCANGQQYSRYIYEDITSDWVTTFSSIDTTVTQDSANTVTSGAVYTAINNAKIELTSSINTSITNVTTLLNTYTAYSSVTNIDTLYGTVNRTVHFVINSASANGTLPNDNTTYWNVEVVKLADGLSRQSARDNEDNTYFRHYDSTNGWSDWVQLLTSGVVDSEVTEGSDNPISSGAVYEAIASIDLSELMDTTPTSGSTNGVTSNGIKTYVDDKFTDYNFNTIDWSTLFS